MGLVEKCGQRTLKLLSSWRRTMLLMDTELEGQGVVRVRGREEWENEKERRRGRSPKTVQIKWQRMMMMLLLPEKERRTKRKSLKRRIGRKTWKVQMVKLMQWVIRTAKTGVKENAKVKAKAREKEKERQASKIQVKPVITTLTRMDQNTPTHIRIHLAAQRPAPMPQQIGCPLNEDQSKSIWKKVRWK